MLIIAVAFLIVNMKLNNLNKLFMSSLRFKLNLRPIQVEFNN